MTTSNIIELLVIVILAAAHISARRYLGRRLDSIDGCGDIYMKKDMRGRDMIQL